MNALDGLRGRIEHRPRDPSRMRLDIAAGHLDDEFREFDVTTCPARDGYALAAQRRDGSEPGLYAVITADEDEMRAALAEGSPPDPDG